MGKGGRGKKKYFSLEGGDRGGWRSFELSDAQKGEIQKALVKAGIPRQPPSKFDRLFAGMETLVNRKLANDNEGRLASKEIKQEIARLRESADHLLENLLLLYGGDLHQSVEAKLDATLILDFRRDDLYTDNLLSLVEAQLDEELDPNFRIDDPSVFIQRLKVDLMMLRAALQKIGECFNSKMGRPDYPKGLKTFLAVELAKVFQNSLGVAPTCTVENEDAQTRNSPFIFLLQKTFKLCALKDPGVKRYASEAVRMLKRNP